MEPRQARTRIMYRTQSSAPHPDDVTEQQNHEYAGQHQHLAGLVQETQQYREMLKNLELLIQPLDLKLNDFDKEKQNFFEKHDVKILTEQNMMLFSGIGQIWKPTNPGHQKASK